MEESEIPLSGAEMLLLVRDVCQVLVAYYFLGFFDLRFGVGYPLPLGIALQPLRHLDFRHGLNQFLKNWGSKHLL